MTGFLHVTEVVDWYVKILGPQKVK